MGDKISFPERDTSQAAYQTETSSDGRGIEASESEARAAMIVENPNDALRPNYEPMGFGPPAYIPAGFNQYGQYGLGVPYDGFYGADYMNNAAFGQYEGGYGLPLETYDEDDVFIRSGGMSMGPYPGVYPGGAAGGMYPGGAAGGMYPGGAPPPTMQRVYTVPQCDAMRYVQCLQDGILAVWGDERNPYFPQQFSKSASIYCYTDMKDGSMVISNRMIPNNVLIQTTHESSDAPNQDNPPDKKDKQKKHKKSKSSAKKSKRKAKSADQNESEDGLKQETTTNKISDATKRKARNGSQNTTEPPGETNLGESSESALNAQEHENNASDNQGTSMNKLKSENKDNQAKESDKADCESITNQSADGHTENGQSEHVPNEKEGTVLD